MQDTIMARVAVLLMVASLATLAFGKQINLVTPDALCTGITSSPSAAVGNFFDFNSGPLFDGKLDTVVTVDTDEAYYESLLIYAYEVKVNRYKIYVGDGTDPSWFPKAWKLTAVTGAREELLDTVTDAQFVNGVYTSNLKVSGKYERLVLKITEDSTPNDNRLKIKMAEIKYFGAKGQYDRQVDGEFMCKNAPVYVLKKDGKMRAQGGVPFSSDSTKSLGALSKLFNDEPFDGQRMYTKSSKGNIIIGYHFPEALTVVQFAIDGQFLWSSNEKQQGILKLEGHTCDPTCDYLGQDGWVSLSRGSMEKHYQRKYLVQKPGSYRAYRIKYTRGFGAWIRNFEEVSFLQCAEGDEI